MGKSKITWENLIIYSLMGILVFGLVLFLIGYMWSFKLNLESELSSLFPNKLSLSKLMKNKEVIALIESTNNYINIDTTNLFTFMRSINSNIPGYSFAALSISGFSFIILSLSLTFILFITTIFVEYIYPKFKKNQ